MFISDSEETEFTIRFRLWVTICSGLKVWDKWQVVWPVTLLQRDSDQLPVVTVDVVQPAALFDHLDHSGHILPGGEAVKPLIFLSGAGDHTAEVPPTLQRGGRGGWRVVVVVDTLLSVWATQDRTWGGDVKTRWQHIDPDQWVNIIDAKWKHCSVSFSLRFKGWKIPTVVLQAGHRFIYSARC